MDKTKRLEYEAREKAVRDYNQLMHEAEQRGKTEIILAMYQSGMPINQISSIVKIDLEELEKMIRSKNL